MFSVGVEKLPAGISVTARDCGWKAYGAHEQIIDRQSETKDVFFVVEGKVRVVNYSVSGREITLDDIEAGGHFGELAAIDGLPRSASVTVRPNQLGTEALFTHADGSFWRRYFTATFTPAGADVILWVFDATGTRARTWRGSTVRRA